MLTVCVHNFIQGFLEFIFVASCDVNNLHLSQLILISQSVRYIRCVYKLTNQNTNSRHSAKPWTLTSDNKLCSPKTFRAIVSCNALQISHILADFQNEALKTRSSATAERQRVSYTRLSRLTHWSCTSLSIASVLQLYYILAKLVSTLSANKPCDIRTLSWIGHSRSFKVILIGAGRSPEWSVVVMCN